MILATWNINSIRRREGLLLDWLGDEKPDLVALQETKCLDEQFPKAGIEDLGYSVFCHGQKGFNGVALLSRHRPDEVSTGLAAWGWESNEARFIELLLAIPPFESVRIACLYAPNGNPLPGPKFLNKIAFMKALHAYTHAHLKAGENLILLGDFNVIPEDIDCYDPEAWKDDALRHPQTLDSFFALKNEGLVDALAMSGLSGSYTFWDYQRGAWQRNHGIRIDHFLLSARPADLLRQTFIDRSMRGAENPSDHVPVRARFEKFQA